VTDEKTYKRRYWWLNNLVCLIIGHHEKDVYLGGGMGYTYCLRCRREWD
jgi:hypothetical protein